MVESGNELNSRNIQGNTVNIEDAENLILDGQQRLTSLWQGLMDAGEKSFFVELDDINASELQVKKVSFKSANSNSIPSPQDQLQSNMLPVSILYDPPDHSSTSPTRLEEWCEEAVPEDSATAGSLRRSIQQNLQRPLEQYKIWFAKFEGIGVDEAVNIFTETNSSSVKVTSFDLAVAEAMHISSSYRLRERIQYIYETYPRVSFYFNRNEERWIPEIGECLLRIACLKANGGMPPKDSNFNEGLKYLYEDGLNNLERIESGLDRTLQILEDNGVPTKDILPRIPPVYVIVALQDEMSLVRESDRSVVNRLLNIYLWRSFFSDRYVSQANDRLYEDYKSLLADIKNVQEGGAPTYNATIFSNDVHVTNARDLKNRSKTIKSKSPIGNAIIALALARTPKDWLTGDLLSPSEIRRLDEENNLDRHHVFPKKILRSLESNRVNHGLNIVLIRKRANVTLGSKAPPEYLEKIKVSDNAMTDSELRSRIESHYVPFDKLESIGNSVVSSYSSYLKLGLR